MVRASFAALVSQQRRTHPGSVNGAHAVPLLAVTSALLFGQARVFFVATTLSGVSSSK